MGIEIYAVVVVYNTRCEDSITLRSLDGAEGVGVLVVDNSTVETGNGEYCRQKGWEYCPMGGNFGLAKAYNRALEYLKGKDGIVVWFDDDTSVPADYFEALRRSAEENPDIAVFVPYVFDEAGLLSPCYIKGCRVRRLRQDEKVEEENITAINTGMAVRLEAFEGYRYDEGYFLDYIDHAFLRDCKERGQKIGVFDAVLRQRFSDNSHDDLEKDLVRFRIFAKDFSRFCLSRGSRVHGFFTLFARSVKLGMIYKTFEFAGILMGKGGAADND